MSENGFEDNSATAILENELRMAKPPDKKRLEVTLASFSQQIEAKQREIRACLPKAEDNTTEILRSLRSEKDNTIARRKKIDLEIAALNQDIMNKNKELTKAQSNLQGYRNEGRIDDTIARLVSQLKNNNFKLSEEKKIVQEIDCLKRSRKFVIIVNDMRKELQAMKETQRRKRAERDSLFKRVSDIKQREDGMRRKLYADKLRHEQLKKELDEVFEQKRSLMRDFKAQENKFYEYRQNVKLKQKQQADRKEQDKRIAYAQDL